MVAKQLPTARESQSQFMFQISKHNQLCNIGSLGSALSRSCDRKTAWQGGKKTGIKQFPGIKAEKMTLMTFTNLKELKTVHLQMNKVTALTYLVKMRTIESSKLTRIALENLGISNV